MRKLIFILLASLLLPAFNQSVYSALVPHSSIEKGEPDPATVKNAVNSFNTLSKKEKKERVQQVKKEVRAFKAAKKAGKEADTNTLLLVILAILLPPLAVYLHQGEINNKFWISLLLTILFWVPGVIYALIVILGNG
ncbi:MAG TPA: YqaE/Pmp3 family membrane protein [Chitinophagaceae bacterium]|nr:YqaE/Pmp3 family membrane protein [Chitinophagaceae bacterium]